MTSILSPDTSTALTLLLYALAGTAGLAGMLLHNAGVRRLAAGAAVLGFLLQTLILFLGFHLQTAGGLSIGAYLQMLAWFLVLCGLVLWGVLRQESPLLFSAILSLILYGLSAPVLQAVVKVPTSLKASFYALHIGALFLSLALIALAFAAAVVFLILDDRIKNKMRLPAFLGDMPALSILDKINAAATLAGFPLFTLGIICGLFYSAPVFGSTLTGDPKEIISIIIWCLFAALFHNRLTRGWHGRKPARLMITIFLLCVFSIVVVNLFMNSHHAFFRN